MEVIIAVTIIGVTLTAVYGLIISVMSANARNLHNLQASQYAAEGLEVMRFMRDSNWLQNYAWDRGDLDLKGAAGKMLNLHEMESPPYWEFSSEPEVLAGIFTRKIAIKKTDYENAIEVVSTVYWTERGVGKNYSVSTFLSDWHD